jgi:hypothetical protein
MINMRKFIKRSGNLPKFPNNRLKMVGRNIFLNQNRKVYLQAG